MAIERAPGGSSLIDVLDRILDKGIVIDAWVRISLVGIDLKYAEAVGITPTVSRPAISEGGSGTSISGATSPSGTRVTR